MAAISRSKLRDMIKLEIKSLVDEDVILNPPSIGEPHCMSYQGSEYDDEYDEYDDEYDEYDVYPPQINKMMNIQEGDCGCGTASYENPYTMEREEDYDLYHHDENHMIDNALQSLTDLGGSVDVDFDHDHDEPRTTDHGPCAIGCCLWILIMMSLSLSSCLWFIVHIFWFVVRLPLFS